MDSMDKVDSRDIYCFECHTLERKYNPIKYCSYCKRSYHHKCLPVGDRTEEQNVICPICKRADEVTEEGIKPAIRRKRMNQLLLIVIGLMEAFDKKGLFTHIDFSTYKNQFDGYVHQMDISILKTNVSKKFYKNTFQFVSDVKYMIHNSVSYKSGKSAMVKVANEFLKIAQRECDAIDCCADCYENEKGSNPKPFSEPCKEPHLLVWAKLSGYPWWPAKLTQVNGNEAEVLFFGDHTRGEIHVNNIFLLSTSPPTEMTSAEETDYRRDMDVAMRELTEHIEKLRAKYRVFTYAEPGIKLEVGDETLMRLLHLPFLQDDHSSSSAAQSNTIPIRELMKCNAMDPELSDQIVAHRRAVGNEQTDNLYTVQVGCSTDPDGTTLEIDYHDLVRDSDAKKPPQP